MKLHFYDESFKRVIYGYTLTKEQRRYTGTPEECIKKSQVDPDRHSILVMEKGELVTFFVLHMNEGVKPYTNNEKSILVRGFSTDFYHQGKGYAKQSLKLLPDFVRKKFPGVDEIILAVNIQNLAAQSLYKKCGFQDEGVRRMGRKGELIIMNYTL